MTRRRMVDVDDPDEPTERAEVVASLWKLSVPCPSRATTAPRDRRCVRSLARRPGPGGPPPAADEAPEEYVRRVLSGWSVHPEPVGQATALFAEARFSEHVLGPAHRAQAIAALEAAPEQRSWRSHDPPPRDHDGREHRRCRHADRVGAHQADRHDQAEAVGAGGARGDPVPSLAATGSPSPRTRSHERPRPSPSRPSRSQSTRWRSRSLSLPRSKSGLTSTHVQTRWHALEDAGTPASVHAEAPETLEEWSSLLDDLEAS